MARKGLFTVLVLVAAMGIMMFAGCREKSHEEVAQRIVEKVSEELALTEDQVGLLNTIAEELIDKAKEMKEEHSSVKDEVIGQLKSDEIDQEKLIGLATEHQAKMRELIPQCVSRLAEFHSTLSPEQKEKLVQHLEEMKDHCRKKCFFSP